MNPHRLHYRSDRKPGEPGSLGNPLICSLFVRKDYTSSAPSSAPWRLLWAESVDSDTFVYAEGECSVRYFSTMRDAIAYGEHRFGETAQRFPD
jgi:hypothetical protein